MPNIKSAIKRVQVAERNNARNRFWKSTVRSMQTKVFEVACQEGAESKEALSKAFQAIDKAVSKGVLHRNTAARKKARLSARVAASSAKA
ncbi:MAG: 30S ribosomal protein S20 [Candidatus Melainabacteria bacterium]|nr:30S ribosomal protein S20 [Candidatus Melainabacteria bacterium]